MAQTTLSIRIDTDDKRRFEAFCRETGMNVSVAVNMFVKSVLREQRLPFEITTDPFYSESNMRRFRRSMEQLEKGEVVIKTMEELERMADE